MKKPIEKHGRTYLPADFACCINDDCEVSMKCLRFLSKTRIVFDGFPEGNEGCNFFIEKKLDDVSIV